MRKLGVGLVALMMLAWVTLPILVVVAASLGEVVEP